MFAAEIVTWFHEASAALVMLALFVTVTVVFTKYAVPVSVLLTVAEPELPIVAVVSVTVGAVESEAAMVTVTDLGDPVNVVWALPAVSVIENDPAAVNVDTVAPPPAVADDVAFTVHTVDDVCTIESIDEIFVNVKSAPAVVDNVEHVIASLPVTVKLIDTDDDVALTTANVTVGAVESEASVTVTDLGDPVNVVWALPAVSVIENDPAAVNVDTVAPPPGIADDVAFTVHTVDDVCAIESIDEMFVNVKSVPAVVDNVEHVIASLPVTVKLIDSDDDVALTTANVTVGAVISPPGLPTTASDCGLLPLAFTARIRIV